MAFRDWMGILAGALLAVLTACGTEAPPPSSAEPGEPDAARGKSLFEQTVVGSASAPGCMTCHALEPGVTLVGPPLEGVGGRPSPVEGLSTEEYLHQSIVEPNTHVLEGFASGVMYQNYGRELTEQQIADLVAFLQTLE